VQGAGCRVQGAGFRVWGLPPWTPVALKERAEEVTHDEEVERVVVLERRPFREMQCVLERKKGRGGVSIWTCSAQTVAFWGNGVCPAQDTRSAMLER
jgi:hypothetical protein